ncbi:hypothetical protein K6119_09810 [Paracrocinitomix mangrovi]|uniref:hypothetical protein n=1 Tax=Paracrocinitomix mangrovi TaxID=2862509 RepID=UPI001C8EE34F|nr:hypothetical protein [Paracrocinitomix mangrovi]UKN03785.1 hypothetical protein K6119_09810 [Paracrocinitomix mangrovi]
MKYPFIIFILIVSQVLHGCKANTDTPEDVVKKIETYLSQGKCEEVLSLCTEKGNFKESVEGTIELGCSPYEAKIDSVICKVNNETATCNCYEERELIFITTFWDLVKEDNKWLIDNLNHDYDITLKDNNDIDESEPNERNFD